MEVNTNNLVNLAVYVEIMGKIHYPKTVSYETLNSWAQKNTVYDILHGKKYGIFQKNGVLFYLICGKVFVDVNQSRLDEKYVK